jgi:homocysteine S-methyltransferase
MHPALSNGPILADGGIETDLIFHHGIDLPEFAAFVLLDDEAGRGRLVRYWESYAALAAAAGVGLQLETPTWRASSDWGARLGYTEHDLERATSAAVALLRSVEATHRGRVHPVVVGGVVGPRYESVADASRFTAPDARRYHRPQIAALARAGVDLVTALTLTNTDEAIGIVQASRELGTPIVISFTVEVDGRLVDGTTLAGAIAAVDRIAPPDRYMINCAHTSHILRAIADGGDWLDRIWGVRPNASSLSHDELDASDELDEGDLELLASELASLRQRLPSLGLIGGCCGTDARHIARFWNTDEQRVKRHGLGAGSLRAGSGEFETR